MIGAGDLGFLEINGTWVFPLSRLERVFRKRFSFSAVSVIIRKTIRSLMYWQFYIVFTLFAYYAVTLRLVGVEHNIYLALMSGLFSFIPFVSGILLSFFSAVFIISYNFAKILQQAKQSCFEV